MGVKSNAQGETQLLAEWLSTFAAGVPSKTHVFVGDQTLIYQGAPMNPKTMKAFEVWSDWADARINFPNEVWLVEAKIVGTAAGYGQVLDYSWQYPLSADYQSFQGKPVVPVLLCAYERPRTAQRYAALGVRTIVYTPQWAQKALSGKIFGSAVDL